MHAMGTEVRCVVVCAGEQPALTPRKLTLMNTTIQSVIQDISFQTSILAVRLNRKRCPNPLGCLAVIWSILMLSCQLAEAVWDNISA